MCLVSRDVCLELRHYNSLLSLRMGGGITRESAQCGSLGESHSMITGRKLHLVFFVLTGRSRESNESFGFICTLHVMEIPISTHDLGCLHKLSRNTEATDSDSAAIL